jgi:hypothetical protein
LPHWIPLEFARRRPQQRPRFAVELVCDVDDVMVALRGRMEGNLQGVAGTFSRRHGVLKIPKERRSFWSPELSLSVEPCDADMQTRVRCVIAPAPQIWTGFVFTYLTLFLIGLSGLIYGLAQLSLGHPPFALGVPLVAMGLSAFVYGAAFIGQGLGADEVYQLRAYLDGCLEQAAERGRRRPKTALDSARL